MRESTETEVLTLARMAYEAWFRAWFGQDAFLNWTATQWDEVPDASRMAWMCVAAEIASAVRSGHREKEESPP